MVAGVWGLYYKTHPLSVPRLAAKYLVNDSYGGRLSRRLNYGLKQPITQPQERWGWGVASHIKDFEAQELKTLVIQSDTAATVTSTIPLAHTILYRGSRDLPQVGI